MLMSPGGQYSPNSKLHGGFIRSPKDYGDTIDENVEYNRDSTQSNFNHVN